MDMLKLCNKCKKENETTFHGYIGWLPEEEYICPICENKMIDTILTADEYCIIDEISEDIAFLEAMIDLKEKDPIEFQLKMQQFKNQAEQSKQLKQQKEVQQDNSPKCPTCGSKNIRKMSALETGASVAFWGIFSKKINKTFKCEKCGHTW